MKLERGKASKIGKKFISTGRKQVIPPKSTVKATKFNLPSKAPAKADPKIMEMVEAMKKGKSTL